jgi:hypothetical protein
MHSSMLQRKLLNKATDLSNDNYGKKDHDIDLTKPEPTIASLPDNYGMVMKEFRFCKPELTILSTELWTCFGHMFKGTYD